MFLDHTHFLLCIFDKNECQFLHKHLSDQLILDIRTLIYGMYCFGYLKNLIKSNNIRSEQFQYSEKYIVLVFIIYMNIELLHVAYSIREFS